MLERRFVKGAEVRAKGDTAKPGIEGYAAVFNEEYVLYEDPGFKMVETIKPGAFSRALKENQDVRCLFNHEPDNVLGRTTNKTLTLSEDKKGLSYTADLDARTRIAADVHCFVERGDVTGCSFAFVVTQQVWREVTADKMTVYSREIEDVDLYDVGPVTYPAYEGTSVGARSAASLAERRSRILSIDGLPEELKARIASAQDSDECACPCRACFSAECNECDMHMSRCADATRCDGMQRSERQRRDDSKKTKRVDGEDLPASAFLYVGDATKTATWSLPWKFSTTEKTKSHLRNALARFEQTKNIPADKKPEVYKELVSKCKEYGIHVSAGGDGDGDDEAKSLARARTRMAEINL